MAKKRLVLWSELLLDCCTKIFALLSSIDQLAFSGVCKSWRAAAVSAPPEEVKKLFVMYEATAKFFDEPAPKHLYNFVDYSSPTLTPERPVYSRSYPDLDRCSFLTAKHGWLLVARPVYLSVFSLFFYDPFTSTAINLPTFFKNPLPSVVDLDKSRLEARFDFIGAPTSPDCIVMAVFFVERLGWLSSTTCSRGQSDWAPLTNHYKRFKSVWLPPSQMVFHEGSFYCVSSRDHVGKVLAFSPETNTIRPLCGHPRQLEETWKYKPGPFNKVLCEVLEAGTGSELVDRLGGMEVVGSCRARLESSPMKRSLPRIEWGHLVTLGEVEEAWFPHYRPLLRMEEGQYLLTWHIPGCVLGNRAWIHKRWVQPGAPTHVQWAPPSLNQIRYKLIIGPKLY